MDPYRRQQQRDQEEAGQQRRVEPGRRYRFVHFVRPQEQLHHIYRYLNIMSSLECGGSSIPVVAHNPVFTV